MTVVPLESLPLGFRFHPTDEELINHYLKGKLTGRIKYEAEVIPEVDVCKCEPWDLPDKALIRSDDPEWFFFAPKDRKYPNGHRSNRATEAGYWKATGKDRFIRSKAARKHSSIIGMKKTLVFHRGRAPKGVRTNWIMHEYRTTEPEFESGDQGGYVLYRLFKKPEEKSLSSDLDEIDNNTSPLTPTRSSPDDIQHDAIDMEQIATPLNEVPPQLIMQDDDPLILPRSVKSWPVGIKRWSGDKTGCSATYHLETDKNYCKMAPNFHAGEVGVKGNNLQDSLAQLADAEYEKIEHDGFPNISSPPLPYADHPFFGNMNQGSDMEYHKVYNSAQDSLDVLLNSMFTNQDQEIPRGSNVLKDSTAEVVPWQNIFDLASYKEIGASSDLDTKEEGFVQGAVGLDASDWTYPHCFIGTERLQMDISDEHPVMKPQLSALYEHTSLLPYDSTGQDGYLVVSAAESLQDLSYSMDEPSNQKNIPSSEDGLDGSEIKIRARQLRQQTDENTIVTEQGSATRRIRLQSSIPYSNGDSESSSPPNKHDVEEAISHMLELSGRMEQQNAKRISINGAINETGITIRTRRLQHLSSSNKLVGQKGKAVRRLRSKVQVGAFLGANGLSKRINNVSTERITKAEVGKHVDHHNLDCSNSLGAALLDKLKELSVDDATPSLKIYQEATPTRSIINHADRNTDLVKRPRKSRGSSIIWVPKRDSAASLFIFLSFLSVILLLLCVRIWERLPNTQYAYKPRGSSNAWVWKGDSVASLYTFLSLLSVILMLLCVGKWGGFRNTRYASKPRSSSITWVWKGDSAASLYIFYSSMSVILLLLCVGIWTMFMNKSICI